MSDVTLPPLNQQIPVSGIQTSGDDNQSVTYQTTDILPPANLAERLEWVRKSYERFFEKILENETLLGSPIADCFSEA